MKDPRCGPEAWAVLDGRIWHATSVAGLRGIRADGCIRPGNRYKGSFVRARRWVSLFDFGPAAIDDWDQWGNWAQWFGATHGAPLSVWLEINREAGRNEILDPEELRLLWREVLDQRSVADSAGPWAGTIIPGVEGCYRGELPADLILRAVVIRADYSVVGDFGPLDALDEKLLEDL